MLKIDDNRKVWVTSDTHFGHGNICRGTTNWRLPNGDIPEKQTRPFETLDKMNASIVNNINEIVGQDDVLIHFGDWSFGGFENIVVGYYRRSQWKCLEVQSRQGAHCWWSDRGSRQACGIEHFSTATVFDQVTKTGRLHIGGYVSS